MFKFRKKSHQEVLDNIPNHIGIIMDGKFPNPDAGYVGGCLSGLLYFGGTV